MRGAGDFWVDAGLWVARLGVPPRILVHNPATGSDDLFLVAIRPRWRFGLVVGWGGVVVGFGWGWISLAVPSAAAHMISLGRPKTTADDGGDEP